MKIGVVDQMTTAMRTIATPRRDCRGGEACDRDEASESKGAGIGFPFSRDALPIQGEEQRSRIFENTPFASRDKPSPPGGRCSFDVLRSSIEAARPLHNSQNR